MEHHADEILKNLVTAMVDINGMKSQHHSEFHVSIEGVFKWETNKVASCSL